MAIMDEIEEVFQEQSICLEGKLLKVNDTYLMQKWNIESAPPLYNDRGELEFPTSIIEPGLWLVQTPFGGNVV